MPPFFNMDQAGDIDWTKSIVNALILLVTLGYAAYTIIDVDHGMTRGWTPEEIAMRIPLDNWQSYETSLAEKPIFTKTLINVVIYLLGDWLSQTLFQKKNVLDFDPWRTLRNGFIGLCFGPLVHEYYQFSDYILPVEAGLTNRLCKIVMDQTIYLTVKCSIYIMAVGMLAGDDFESAQQSVKSRIKGIVTTAWKFWPLVHCVTYSVIPARHRILWVNCVDLVWSAILASMSNAKPTEEAMDDAATVTVEPDEVKRTAMLQTLVADDMPPPLVVEPLVLTDEESISLLEIGKLEVVPAPSVDKLSGDLPSPHSNATTYALT
jgi:protein Mpv17